MTLTAAVGGDVKSGCKSLGLGRVLVLIACLNLANFHPERLLMVFFVHENLANKIFQCSQNPGGGRSAKHVALCKTIVNKTGLRSTEKRRCGLGSRHGTSCVKVAKAA